MSRRGPRPALIALLVLVAGCTAGTSGDDVAETLVQPEQLTGRWQPQDGAATQPAGGFCEVGPTVEDTGPVNQAVAVLVDGELLVRDTRLRYDGTAQQAYDALSARLADCGQDPESTRLDLSVEPLPVPVVEGGRSDGYRLRVPIAGTVLLLDLAVWQHGSV